MKIFNIENGVEKAYVQIHDIRLLNSHFEEFPSSIYYELVKNLTIIDDETNMSFIEFSKQDEIDFLKKTDWIIDYKDIKKLSQDEILQHIKEIIHEINNINKLSFKEKTPDLLARHSLLNHKMTAMIEILQINQRKKTISFPLVPDSDSFSITSNDGLYQIKTSLDSNILLLYRTDGLCLSDLDLIPQSLIYESVIKNSIEKSKTGDFLKDFDISRKFSEDRKYLIIQFKNKMIKQEKGIQKLIKSILNNPKKY